MGDLCSGVRIWKGLPKKPAFPLVADGNFGGSKTHMGEQAKFKGKVL